MPLVARARGVDTPERFLCRKGEIGAWAPICNRDPCNFFTLRDMVHPAEAARRVCEGLAGHYCKVHVKDLRMAKGVHLHIEETPFGTSATDRETALRTPLRGGLRLRAARPAGP